MVHSILDQSGEGEFWPVTLQQDPTLQEIAVRLCETRVLFPLIFQLLVAKNLAVFVWSLFRKTPTEVLTVSRLLDLSCVCELLPVFVTGTTSSSKQHVCLLQFGRSDPNAGMWRSFFQKQEEIFSIPCVHMYGAKCPYDHIYDKELLVIK